MRRPVAIVIAIAIAIASTACGADEVAVLDDPAEFLAQVRAAECDSMVRCRIFASAESCEVYRRHRLPLSAIAVVPDVDWLSALADGSAVYSPADAAACLAAWRSSGCRRTAARDRCASVFRGVAITGTTTRTPAACGAGYWENSSCSGACCRGTCGRHLAVPTRPEGTTCDAAGGDRRCDRHLACRLGRCARLALGDACSEDLECPPGLVCDDRCRPRAAIGDACRSDHACSDLGSYCGLDGRCRRYALDGEPCVDGACGPGLGCGSDGRCAGLHLGEAAPCWELGVALCGRGLYCDPLHGTCVAQLADGAHCSGDHECAGGLCGDGFRCGVPCP